MNPTPPRSLALVASLALASACSAPPPELEAPRVRPIAPLSGETVTSQTPTLRWTLAAGDEGARVEICAERACTTTEQSFDATGDSATPATALSAGVHYWRLRARRAGTSDSVTSPTWQFTVGPRSAAVATSFGTAADVNGDGLGDVLVTATGADELRAHFGRRNERAVDAATASLLPTGSTAQGSEVSVGDVNGDGFVDALVETAAGDARGFAVYYGSATGLGSAHAFTRSFDGAEGTMHAAIVGDLNRDGRADIAVARMASEAPLNRVEIYLGQAEGLAATPGVTLAITESFARGAARVSAAGDVNGDGYADLLAYPTGSETVNVYLGSATGPGVSPATAINVRNGGGEVGLYPTFLGDVNGDGYADVAIATLLMGRTTTPLFVHYGSATGLSASPQVTIGGIEADAVRTSAITPVGADINGDGYTDLVAGSRAESGMGGVLAFSGGETGLFGAPSIIASPSELGSLGVRSLASVSDVNGDGFGDVVFGSTAPRGSARPPVTLHFGSDSGLLRLPIATLETPPAR